MTSDNNIDNLIRTKIQSLHNNSRSIQPSADFVRRTMKRIRVVERQRRFWVQVWIVVGSLAPFVVRETWMFVRGDYFAVSSVPLVGNWIASIYQLFLSPVALYLLLFGGIVSAILYISKFRRGYDSFARLA